MGKKTYVTGAQNLEVSPTAAGVVTVLRLKISQWSNDYRTGRCISPSPGAGFPSSIARQPRGCQFRTVRLRKALGEVFLSPTFLASTLSQLWRYRAWKIGPGVCDVHRRVLYIHTALVERSTAYYVTGLMAIASSARRCDTVDAVPLPLPSLACTAAATKNYL